MTCFQLGEFVNVLHGCNILVKRKRKKKKKEHMLCQQVQEEKRKKMFAFSKLFLTYEKLKIRK